VGLGEPDQQPAQGVAGVADGLLAVEVRLQPQPQVAVDHRDDRGWGRDRDQPLRPVPGVAVAVQRRLGHPAGVEQQHVRALEPGQQAAPAVLDRYHRRSGTVGAAVEGPQLVGVRAGAERLDRCGELRQVRPGHRAQVRIAVVEQDPSQRPAEVGARAHRGVAELGQARDVSLEQVQVDP